MQGDYGLLQRKRCEEEEEHIKQNAEAKLERAAEAEA
jgi:hypothetical protein